MARFMNQSAVQELGRFVHYVTGFEENEENYQISLQFAVSNVRYHRFMDVDSHRVSRALNGVCEKLKIHSETTKARLLAELAEKFLSNPVFEGRDVGKTDTHYSILQFLLLVAESPMRGDYVQLNTDIVEDVEEEFDWGAYLLEGVEPYRLPSEEELSDWSEEDEETLEENDIRVPSPSHNIVPARVVEPDDHQMAPYIVESSTIQGEESMMLEGTDWLSRNLIPQYWRGEKLEIETGKYNVCHLNRDWEAYKQAMNPLQGQAKNMMVSENILLREIIWMLMGIANLQLFMYTGKRFLPIHNLTVPHLTEESLHDLLTEFTRYGSYIQTLQTFVTSCCHGSRGNVGTTCQTYQAFASTVAAFLQNIKSELCTVEQKLIKQEEVVTLLTLSSELKPMLRKVRVVYMVYTRGVQQGEIYELPSQRATLLLTTLYNTLMGCDTLYEMPIPGEGGGVQVESTDILKLLLPMWIQTCQPYINIIDTWISSGHLEDPVQEFVIHRNKNIKTLDETFWEKSFTFHTMAAGDEAGDEPQGLGSYATTDWAPKFLQPVLQQVVLTGKSMEMLEGLGKLAEFDSRTKLDIQAFKEGHLYMKFLTSLQSLLGTKPDSGSGDSSTRETTRNPVFTPDIERQLREKGIFDNFLMVRFEQLMRPSTDKHTIIDEQFTRLMDRLDLESLQPVELILRECLYPHIQAQYERVCYKLVEILKKDYKLMEYLASMRKFYLMEAGDCMFVFYSEIFDKIRMHEPWRDTTCFTWALHEAFDRYFPDEVPRLQVFVDVPDGVKDCQPINVTDCLKLQYQVPVPVDVVINARCEKIYNQVFCFLLQVKRAKYCLDELRFYDLEKENVLSSMSDDCLDEGISREAKLHRMHLLRMRLIYFVNGLHNYIMTRILHSTGLEFTRDLETATDLDQIIEVHSSYVRKIHERCLLHRKNAFLKEAVMKMLNLVLLFQARWDTSIDQISMKQISEIETEFSRCVQFLASFLNSVIQRGSFPHLESLAFGLESLVPS